MRQLVQSRRTGKLWLAAVPVPACGPGGVLVRTRCSVISAGTEKQSRAFAAKSLIGKARGRPDLVRQVVDTARAEGARSTIAKALARLDRIDSLGYSAAGDVVEAGAAANGIAPGDRVALAGVGYASHAEFNAVPCNLCAKLPDGVSYEEGAFATVGAVALQGVRRAQPLIGERVVVIGLGLVGLLTVQILKANGCAVLGVDLDGERAALAGKLGADAAVAAREEVEGACEGFTGGRGADAVIVAAASPGSEPIVQAARLSRAKGRIVAVGAVGMDVPREIFYRKELDLRLSMSYGPGRYDPTYEERGQDYPFAYVRFTEQRNLESFLYLVEQGKVTPAALVSHRFAFDAALDAYALVEGRPAGQSPSRPPVGIVLEYPAAAPLERPSASASSVRETSRAACCCRTSSGRPASVWRASARARGRPHKMPRGVSASTTPRPTRPRCSTTREIAAVFVATRHASHALLAAAALRAGKHVFVEKPLCLTHGELGEIEQALEEARAAGHEPCLTVGFNRRFAPHTRAPQAAFAFRGTPMVVSYRVRAGTVPADSWRADPAEGGRIVGEGCHFVDFCNALVGSRPESAVAQGVVHDGSNRAGAHSVLMTIRYGDGSLASIQFVAAGGRRLPKEHCEVFADGRTAVMEDFRTTRIYDGGRNVRGRQAKGFAEHIDTFVTVCRDGGPWPIPWLSIAGTHQVCFGVVRSLETGKLVRLPASPFA